MKNKMKMKMKNKMKNKNEEQNEDENDSTDELNNTQSRRVPPVIGNAINLENMILNDNNPNMTNVLNFLNRTSHYNYRRANSLQSIINSTLNDKPAYKNILSNDGEKELKKVKYKKNSPEFPSDKCPITHLSFEENEEITQLPCKHCFDIDAIAKWLKEEKAECPVCRYKLDSKEEKITNENQVEQQTQTTQNTEHEEQPLSETRTTFFNSLSRLHVHPFGPRNQNRIVPRSTPTQSQIRIARVINQQDEDAELQQALYESIQNLDISNNNNNN